MVERLFFYRVDMDGRKPRIDQRDEPAAPVLPNPARAALAASENALVGTEIALYSARSKRVPVPCGPDEPIILRGKE
jgi:hypothetical protein